MLARFKRLDGFDVHFLTGTDEHGQKVEKAARDAGQSPQDFTDEIAAKFAAMVAAMGVRPDDTIRTTEARHKQGATALWKVLREKDQIYPRPLRRLVRRPRRGFLQRRRPDHAAGRHQAWRPTGAPVEWVREPNYLFRLSQWQDALLRHYEENPDFIGPAGKRNEMLSFIRGGLNDLSVSRQFVQLGHSGAGRRRRMSCMSGWTRWRTTSPRWAILIRGAALAVLAGRSASGRQGHPALSTPSTGRPS